MPHSGLLAWSEARTADGEKLPRDESMRPLYLNAALGCIPRLLGAIDRNPYRPSYGCFDREYWHYRTSSFASEMYQEGVLALALVYAHDLPGNRWHRNPRIRELAIAAIQFSARNCHADGSCDDYYPFERALGAAVFSLQAAARAYQLLELDSRDIVAWLERRAQWIIHNDESGRLANHHALAALGLARVAEVTGHATYREAAEECVRRVLSWQSSEGWFEEYCGADPGYQTVTIDCLAKLRRMWSAGWLDEPLRRAVRFAGLFLHPDNSYGGEYGSRGTCHFYPHGFELLASDNAEAARLADGFLQSLSAGTYARFEDDRMYVHRLGNLIEAYLDWRPQAANYELDVPPATNLLLRDAGVLVRGSEQTRTIVSAARGGVFKHFAACQLLAADAGLIVETNCGMAVSQNHDRSRSFEQAPSLSSDSSEEDRLSIKAPLHWARFETVTPLKQAVLHLGMITVGRWFRTLVRRILQRRLITARRACPIVLTRTFEFSERELRVVDRIELVDRSVQIKRMHFANDLQAAYVAAANVYHTSSLEPWIDLQDYIAELNDRREVTIVRRF